MVFVESAVFVLVFAAVYAAYVLGRRSVQEPFFARGLQELRRYSPPIEFVLEYRNENGFVSVRRAAVLRALRHGDGRLYLFCLCLWPRRPRLFRVDRIISVATTDGEVIDTYRFLAERLAIPREWIDVVGRSTASVSRDVRQSSGRL